MMIAGINIEPFLLSVAAKLAHMGDEQQAAFLNTFADELKKACDTGYNNELQAAFIGMKANDNLKNICGIIATDKQ